MNLLYKKKQKNRKLFRKISRKKSKNVETFFEKFKKFRNF